MGVNVKFEPLLRDRQVKPYQVGAERKFLSNPCESALVAAPAQVTPRRPAAAVARSPLEILRQIIADHAELPVTSVLDDHRLLSDLHLNSITVTQMVTQAARELASQPPVMPTGFANVTVAAAAEALRQMAETSAREPQQPTVPAGLIPWTRCFTVTLQPSPARHHGRTKAVSEPADWRVFLDDAHPWKTQLQETFRAPGDGVVICLMPKQPGDAQSEQLFQAARSLRKDGADRFVLFHHGTGSGAFARSLRQEFPLVDVCVVRIPSDRPDLLPAAYEDAVAAKDFEEIWYDEDGVRSTPVLQTTALKSSSKGTPLGPNDVLLVTGGAKGIGAECALAIGRQTGAKLLLLGRSSSTTDPEVAQNLRRFTAAGIRHRFLQADVTDHESTRTAIEEGQRAWGPVTAVMHSCGRNAPALIESLDAQAVAQTLAPKITGLRNVLAAIDSTAVKLLISFGSVIGRIGMRGNSDYALANESLRHLTDDFAAANPHCRCLTLEWSIWSGVGMGERLGSVDALAKAGISPITPEMGTGILLDILSSGVSGALIVASRFTALPLMQFARRTPPLLRFAERILAFIPGVEFIADSKLDARSDPYLLDHALDGELLFPAVMGIEAMAQAAYALTGENTAHWSDLAFERPILVDRTRGTTLRTYASVRADGSVALAIRSSETNFQVDHFRASLRTGETPAPGL